MTPFAGNELCAGGFSNVHTSFAIFQAREMQNNTAEPTCAKQLRCQSRVQSLHVAMLPTFRRPRGYCPRGLNRNLSRNLQSFWQCFYPWFYVAWRFFIRRLERLDLGAWTPANALDLAFTPVLVNAGFGAHLDGCPKAVLHQSQVLLALHRSEVYFVQVVFDIGPVAVLADRVPCRSGNNAPIKQPSSDVRTQQATLTNQLL